MSTLDELCSDLPVDPLPPARKRNPSVPHAPVRNHRLNSTEQKVFILNFIYFCGLEFSCCYYTHDLAISLLCEWLMLRKFLIPPFFYLKRKEKIIGPFMAIVDDSPRFLYHSFFYSPFCLFFVFLCGTLRCRLESVRV
jgi:hypothetical protein